LEAAVPVGVGVEGSAATAIGATAAGVGALPPDDINLAFDRKADGKSHTSKVKSSDRPEPAQKERIQRTRDDMNNHFNELKKDRENWEHKYKDGKVLYMNKTTNEIRYGDYLHNEIESFGKNGEHRVIDPVTGKEIIGKGGTYPNPKW
jgi:hypothetical protein